MTHSKKNYANVYIYTAAACCRDWEKQIMLVEQDSSLNKICELTTFSFQLFPFNHTKRQREIENL